MHGPRPPCRASAPPRSATAKAVSERPARPSRSCPLRAPGSGRSAPADGPAELGSTPGPSPSERRRGWPAGVPRADVRPSTPRSTPPPTRTARRRRVPAHTLDIARIDRPRPPLLLGATGRARPFAAPSTWWAPRSAHHEGSGDQPRAFTFSIATLYVLAASAGDDRARVDHRFRAPRGHPCAPCYGQRPVFLPPLPGTGCTGACRSRVLARRDDEVGFAGEPGGDRPSPKRGCSRDQRRRCQPPR